MRKRSEVRAEKPAKPKPPEVDRDHEREVVVPHDITNEQIVFAAAIVDVEARGRLVRLISPEKFLYEPHKAGWAAMRELSTRKLDYDPATLQRIAGDRVDVRYLEKLAASLPDVTPNLDFHLDALLWDAQRAGAVEGPIAALLEAVRNPREQPERVRALARAVGAAFEGGGGSFLLDSVELARTQAQDIERRATEGDRNPFGIDGWDYYEPDDDGTVRKRLLVGMAPALVTVLTGVPGSGKSTVSFTLALAQAGILIGEPDDARAMLPTWRRVLFGAWEMQGGPVLEIMAAISMGLSLTRITEGTLTAAEREAHRRRMFLIGERVRFMRNPFKRAKGTKFKITNDDHLDILQEEVTAAGCEVAFFDLWERMLVDLDPQQVSLALVRTQGMAEDLAFHAVISQQLKAKDVEQRKDKRPTRADIKGSGAYFEVADYIFGINRPGLWKSGIADDTIESLVLKQRRGRWPLAIANDWDGEHGLIRNGRSIPYEQPGEGSEIDAFIPAPMSSGKRRRRRS